MSLRTTFVLMILFMALGSVAFFDPFKWKEKREAENETAGHVFTLKDKKLEWLSITQGDKTTRLECVKVDGCTFDGTADWKMTQPMADLGDNSTIGSLAGAIMNLNFQEKVDFEAGLDPKEFGLEQGKPVVEFKTKQDAAPIHFEIGGPTAIGPNVYLRNLAEPKRLYVVASFFPQMLTKDSFHWRNKRIFPVSQVENVKEIGWAAAGKIPLRAVKNGSQWQITAPVQAPANFIMMEGLVSTLVHSSDKAIFSDSRASAEAKKILRTKPLLTAEFQDGKDLRKIAFYAQTGAKDIVAAVDGKDTLVLMEPTPFERFKKELLEYRDRRLFAKRDRNSVDEMDFEFPRDKNGVKLKFRAGVWVAEPALKEPLSQARIKAVAVALTESEAKTFLPLMSPSGKEYSTHTADVTVALRGAGIPEDKASFLVAQRKLAVTAGNTKGEVRVYGEDLLKSLPIRLADFYEANNKLVPEITKDKDADGHGNDHSEHDDDHE